ncbi:MAG: DNA repair protein RadA [Alphaproteobacteria bacterium]|nr:DNA repair protein RadA [Rhodospirillaceae bacterium]MDP6022675.1 DNA repair protein RadA [Alphaproteobacteria bacterium]MDP6253622.1 DNA repair protein RadA [Alphaproteobacteria bacterium]MDP7054459.1 DNA repair protein RadA [Alphaproteobacteria bacterium]MDP7230974.1 DNA repair protein RadA [Alphaproteobacteria bacterium]
MAKAAEIFVCQSCGAVHGKWSGRCSGCGEWNSIAEEAAREAPPKGLESAGKGRDRGRVLDFHKLNKHGDMEGPRTVSGLGEFDRVCGGGLVPGSAILIGGDPGIGKSTILLQVVARLAQQGVTCAYISGEEAPAQVRMRARRLGLEGAPLDLAAATSVRDIVATMDGPDSPRVVVIDSIQTMYVDSIESAPGTVSQVRTSAQELIRAAKRTDICLLLVGHVTKDGQIAGPRVLEHMVDSVLYFEGERGHQFRILRAVKNRYGPTDEIGVFEMSDAGLMEVSNPSALFLANRGEAGDISGSAVFAGLEGSRPVLVEIQALVAPSPPGNPRRTVVGWDGNRLAMVLAVLDARCGLGMAGHDVYLNVAGGLRINEPAADLAVAAALVSSLMEVPVPQEAVLFGEISLSGEVRPVAQAELRMKEAAKLGFACALAPPARKQRKSPLAVSKISRLPELVELFASHGVKAV